MPTAEESDSLRRRDIDEWLAASSSGAAFDGNVSSERRGFLCVIIVYASYSPVIDISTSRENSFIRSENLHTVPAEQGVSSMTPNDTVIQIGQHLQEIRLKTALCDGTLLTCL